MVEQCYLTLLEALSEVIVCIDHLSPPVCKLILEASQLIQGGRTLLLSQEKLI